jgi:[ribosomal protein S18]-alanine N-acetyltransferase
MSGIIIRPMETRDLAEVISIEMACFTLPWSEQAFLSEIYKRNAVALVAESGGMIIAYICSHQVLDEAHLLDLAVHPDYRRRCLASSLLSNASDILFSRGCLRLYLEVRSSNLTGQEFYRKQGFSEIALRKDYYIKPDEGAVIMIKELTAAGLD